MQLGELGGQGLDGGGVLGAPRRCSNADQGVGGGLATFLKAPGAYLSGDSLAVMAPEQDHPRMWSILQVLLV